MTNAQGELETIAVSWTEELGRALQTRTAWSHLGNVDIVEHTGAATLGGVIDRRLIKAEPGKPLREVLERWRGSSEGRIVDRMVVAANTMLLKRLPPMRASEPFGPDWLRDFEAKGPIVVLGAAADLVHVVRIFRDTPLGARLRPSAADCKAGSLVAVAGEGLSATMVCMVSLSLTPQGLHVVSVVDNKSRTNVKLARADAFLAPAR
ncbi:hypothetical protein [Polyangium aurulentum]|uniref:hypothetical protein n=1 Tax=Polyangium aurulentum TaxID=2567896 RepID=UPI0010AE4B39|nr:hypothetical protein [Polyangium aurulentum]UQA55068.1 hypothetical protein E8A73_027355 [Polyangium aurulentum]